MFNVWRRSAISKFALNLNLNVKPFIAVSHSFRWPQGDPPWGQKSAWPQAAVSSRGRGGHSDSHNAALQALRLILPVAFFLTIKQPWPINHGLCFSECLSIKGLLLAINRGASFHPRARNTNMWRAGAGKWEEREQGRKKERKRERVETQHKGRQFF